MKLIKRNIKNNGFTLIELIVVVSILLILSGFMVPKVLGYQDKAIKAKVVNTARQIFDATMESYTEEEGSLDATKLSTSIFAVTGLPSGTTTVTVGVDKSATVIFASDSKTYDVVITANENKFVVNQHTVSNGAAPIINEMYKNK